MQISAEQRWQRAQAFDEIAELYDQGRREPPSWLYETLFSCSVLDPGRTSIPEIGCGTGKSTLPLARRGCQVVALEMGANLSRQARPHQAAFPKVRIINCARKFADDRAAADMNELLRVDRGGAHRLPSIRIEAVVRNTPLVQKLGEDTATTFVNCIGHLPPRPSLLFVVNTWHSISFVTRAQG